MENTEIKSRLNLKKWLITGAVLLLLLVAEVLFDIFEIGFGRLLWLTNPIRPQTGRLWDEDRKEQVGLSELDSAQTHALPLETTNPSIQNLKDMEALLSIRRSLSMNRDEFNDFYKSIPQGQSRKILDPLDLFTLNRGTDWHKTQMSLSGNQLVFYFLDGYEKPIQESHVSLQQDEDFQAVSLSELEQDERFRGRLVPADVFFQAFDQLPRSYQLQIVNDPYKLVQWESSLQRVGLSLFIEPNGVELVFEIQGEDRPRRQSMYASEMAVGYLIREINSVDGAPRLQTPINRDRDAEENY
jgi:hypothetical protein